MRMKKTIFALWPVTTAVLAASVSTALAAPPAQPAGTKLFGPRPIRIEPATVLPSGTAAVDFGLAFEMDREFLDRDYDNLRLAPMGMRFGLLPDFEIGGSVAFSANDEEDLAAPDESGVEGVTLFGKVGLNTFAALRFGLTFAGDKDVFPHPNDGLDLFADLALQRPLGGGLLVGEFGYTVQGGDLDFNHYINYGLGYVFPLSPVISLNAELTGEEAHFGTSANTLDLLLGVNLVLADMVRLAPYFTFGLYDASPDYAFGAAVEVRF